MNHPTTPEAPETIEAQLQWLRAGKRKAVLLTPGCVLPELPLNADCVPTAAGLIVFDCRRVSRCDIIGHLNNDSLGELLGYGIPEKPGNEGARERGSEPASTLPHSHTPSPNRVIVVRGANGVEKQAVVTDSERLDAARAAAHAVKDAGDTVTVEDAQRVLTDRLKSLDARELKVRPFHPEQDAEALDAAAAADHHAPLNPTHVIERHGQIVGYFGCSSLPLYRLWFHSKELKAPDSLRLLFLIENNYRMAGVQTLGTIINTSSPFYPVAARGGYLENGGDRLFLKDL